MEFLIQHLKEVTLTIPEVPIDDPGDIHSIMEKISFSSFSTATAKKFGPVFCHYKLYQFALCHWKPTHYLQNFHKIQRYIIVIETFMQLSL